MKTLMFVNLVTLQGAAATRTERLDPLALIMQASPTVKLVMVVLVMMSLVCWFIIGAMLSGISIANAYLLN